jgi:hypothetical protein
VAPPHDSPTLEGPLALAVAEACWGSALVFSGDRVLQRVAQEPVGRPVIRIARVLGIRELLQALITAWRPTRRTLRFAAAVDALHAATMVTAASARVGPRRLSVASAGVASVFSAAGLVESRRP